MISFILFCSSFSASGKIDDQIFINKNLSAPGVLRFHPYEPYLAVSDRGGVRYALAFYSFFFVPHPLRSLFSVVLAGVGNILDYNDSHVRSFKNVFRDVNSLVDSLNLF